MQIRAYLLTENERSSGGIMASAPTAHFLLAPQWTGQAPRLFHCTAAKRDNSKNNKSSGFSIREILDMSPRKRHTPPQQILVRPWTIANHNKSDESDEDVDILDDSVIGTDDVSPLDALLKMTSQSFAAITNLASDKQVFRRDHLCLGKSGTPPKKRRKSRTAFSNHQIYELEKRFLYQKYLTPVDRDEIAQSLGLSNAQVITWFQNRRAKLKRDLEELKADVNATQTGLEGGKIETSLLSPHLSDKAVSKKSTSSVDIKTISRERDEET